MRYAPLALIVGLIAPLVFPAALALVLVAGASLFFPPVALIAGILTDATYRTSAVAIPYASILGLFFMLMGYTVHWFVRTRIMG